MSNQYNEDSIVKLSPLEFTRTRPDTYLGSNEDATQLALELITNCVDEHLIGNCDEIFVDFNKDGSLTVRDAGQGILPNVVKEDGRTVLEMVYGDINTSGKYDKSDEAVYKVSTGAFGIGSALTNFLSHWLIATTKKNGQFETVYFKEGVFEKRETGKCDKSEHGVEVKYLASEEFFVSFTINKDKLRNILFNISCICPRLTIHFGEETIFHPNGIEDLVVEKVGDSLETINSRCVFDIERGRQKLNLAITYNTRSNAEFIGFCNYGLIEAGAPFTAIKSCLTRTINKWGQEQGILKAKETLTGNDIQEGIVLVFNLVSPNIRYDSQTKVRCTSTTDNPFINEVLSEQLLLWLDNNPKDGESIIEKAILAKRAAEAARKARAAVKNKAKNTNKKVKIMNPDKLKDAEYVGEDSTLLLVEGLSAGSSIALARDPEKYGILMLRGKLINTFANKHEKLLKNEEIQLLLKALNIDEDNYDNKKLRYGRVGICVDSDDDGFHIGLLVMAALQYFCPKFIEEGRLCWLRSPLYIVKNNGKEDYYYTDEELEAAKKAGKVKGEVQRAKGLGSLSPDQAHDSMFTDKQKMDILLPDENSAEMLRNLMGSDGNYRKDYIFNKIDFSQVRE